MRAAPPHGLRRLMTSRAAGLRPGTHRPTGGAP